MNEIQESRVVCPECNSIRMLTPSGACCPNGHGKIQPGVNEKEITEFKKLHWLRTLPQVKRISSRRYSLSGKILSATWFKKTPGGVSYKVPYFSVARNSTILARSPEGTARLFREVNNAKK